MYVGVIEERSTVPRCKLHVGGPSPSLLGNKLVALLGNEAVASSPNALQELSKDRVREMDRILHTRKQVH